jgi:hypothetical protein
MNSADKCEKCAARPVAEVERCARCGFVPIHESNFRSGPYRYSPNTAHPETQYGSGFDEGSESPGSFQRLSCSPGWGLPVWLKLVGVEHLAPVSSVCNDSLQKDSPISERGKLRVKKTFKTVIPCHSDVSN